MGSAALVAAVALPGKAAMTVTQISIKRLLPDQNIK